MTPLANEIRTLFKQIMDVEDLILIHLEHCPQIDVLYSDPKDIMDFLFGNDWLDVGILQAGGSKYRIFEYFIMVHL